ncbi:MAG: FAD-dependent oxidoreductase, partial [Solirubrobacterales bacterium]
MPKRATKSGSERTPLTGTHDVLICGASFAGLAVARELAGSGADVLIVDRYEIGERQTSACGIPTEWMRRLELMDAERQRFDTLVTHTPHGDARYRLPWTFSTFDYRQMCALLWEGCDARFEIAKVNGRAGAA